MYLNEEKQDIENTVNQIMGNIAQDIKRIFACGVKYGKSLREKDIKENEQYK